VHIPRWKERLILKPREVVVEASSEPEAPSDLQGLMLNTILDLENELKLLRKRMESREKIGEEDVDRLKYIQEEVKGML
jgi:metallo-beta-lactamase family protein